MKISFGGRRGRISSSHV